MVIDRTKYMSADEVKQLRTVTEARAIVDLRKGRIAGPLAWMVVDLALATGLRVLELTAIRFKDIDLKRSLIKVRRRKRKKKVIDSLAISPELIKHLKEYIGDRKTGKLFIGERGELTKYGLQQIWKSAIKRAGLPIISSSDTKTGDEVFTLGFPQIQIQGYEPKYTQGSINSLSGMGGNRRLFQISIPVQPGNSGGPLLNSKGQVVGVVAARLNEITTLVNTGSIPQNVNYAIKSSFVLPFLDTLPDFKPNKKVLPNKRTELITEAKNAVILVICY